MVLDAEICVQRIKGLPHDHSSDVAQVPPNTTTPPPPEIEDDTGLSLPAIIGIATAQEPTKTTKYRKGEGCRRHESPNLHTFAPCGTKNLLKVYQIYQGCR